MVLINNQGSHRNLQALHLAKRTSAIGCPCESIGMVHCLMRVRECVYRHAGPAANKLRGAEEWNWSFSLKHGPLFWPVFLPACRK